MFKDTDYGAPPEPKSTSRVMSDNEIKQVVLESKEFAYAVGEKLRDCLTNEQASLIAYYMLRGVRVGEKVDDHMRDLGILITEELKPIIKKTLDNEIKEYKNKNDITNSRFDF